MLIMAKLTAHAELKHFKTKLPTKLELLKVKKILQMLYFIAHIVFYSL